MILLYVFCNIGFFVIYTSTTSVSYTFLSFLAFVASLILDTVEKSQENRFGALTSLLGRSIFPRGSPHDDPGTSETNVLCNQQ